MCRMYLALLPVAVFWTTAVPALAQEARATLSGTITDSSGSAIPAAQVRIINTETAIAFTAVSNDAGQYRFLFVNPGTYRLTVEKSGFRSLVREGIDLSLGQAGTLDVALQVGTQSETVTVVAQAPLLEAEKADRGMVVDQKSLSELPIVARVPVLMATLTPGVIWTQPNYNSIAPFSNCGLLHSSVNG